MDDDNWGTPILGNLHVLLKKKNPFGPSSVEGLSQRS